MSYEDYQEEESRTIEPEVKTEQLEKGLKITVWLSPDEIVRSVSSQLCDEVKSYMREAIRDQVKQMLKPEFYWEKDKNRMGEDLKVAIKEVVREKFDQVYPDAVDNQVNKIIEELKQVSFFAVDSYDRNAQVKTLRETALKRIDEMVKAEIKPVIEEQKKCMQEYVQNQFAQQFVRAMIPLGLEQKR